VIEHLAEAIDTPEGAWTPGDEQSTAPSMSLRNGLRISSNRAAVQLLQRVGIPRTVEYVKSMGMGDVPGVPSLALGAGEVTLEAMTAAYAAFANRGLVPKPMLIRRVEDRDGRVLFAGEESATRAVSETTAFLMSTMLADVVNAGTGARVRSLGFTLPAAGKTGTTNDFNDAWFVGFTPKLAAGVWVGFDQPQTILRNGFAGDVAVPMWARFMKLATRKDEPAWFSPPPGITTATVCRVSGRLATEGCERVVMIDDKGRVERRSAVYTEYFARGTEPTAYCDLHPTRGLLGTIAGWLGSNQERPSPPVARELLPPPPALSTIGARRQIESLPAPVAETVKPKRGFWSRIFGIGRRDDRKNPREDPRPSAPAVGDPKREGATDER
jgi:penicillin-binding protein 1A